MRIKGIPIKIHSSWVVIFGLFAWSAQSQALNDFQNELTFVGSWLVGLMTSVLLFGSIFLYELGHSCAALREGVRVKSITLFFLGGLSQIEKEMPNALASLRVAIAGPSVSIALAIFFILFANIFFTFNPIMLKMFLQLGSLNLLLTVINLFPGLPLNGGVILKSVVWHFTGNPRKGVIVANNASKILSLIIIFFGSLVAFSGNGIWGIWLIFLGWLCLASSRAQKQIISVQDILAHSLVEDAKNKRYRILEDNQSLIKLSKLLSSNKSSDDWILICRQGRWVGFITDKPLKEIPSKYWDKHYISEFCEPLKLLPQIKGKTPLWKVIQMIEKKSLRRLLVLDDAGLPNGTIERVDIGLKVLNILGIKPPEYLLDSARKNNAYPLGLSLGKLVDEMIISGLVKDIN